MWTLRTYSGKEFRLTDKQKDGYLKAIEAGAKVIAFGEFVLSPNFEYLVSDEMDKVSRLEANPVLNDPDFRKWAIDKVASAGVTLDARYPLHKYQQEWDEAKANIKYLTEIRVINE